MEINRDNASEILSDFFIDKKMTQKRLAFKCGISENTVSNIMLGMKPHSLTVNKINRYLKKVKN